MAEKKAIRTIKILLVIGSLDIGGTEQQLVALASNLLHLGYRVMVFSLSAGPLRQTLRSKGVPTVVARLNRRKGGSRLIRRVTSLALASAHLFFLLLQYRPTIVHFFLPEAYLVGAPLAALARIPIRVMSRRSLNTYQQTYPRIIARIERYLHRTMTAVVGNSKSVVQQLLGSEGVEPSRIGLIYNGLDVARFPISIDKADIRTSTRAALGTDSEHLLLIMVANLIAYKGHLDLLEALGSIRQRLPAGWRLLLVGRDDGIGGRLRERAGALAIRDNVIFLGPRSDVPELLLASDIGILSSHQEGFSNAVLEGMAARLPMVVTSVGGNSEAVIDGESGFVVAPHDPARLADAILRLAIDPELRAKLGCSGRLRVEAQFSLERCIAGYDALYRHLAAGGQPGELAQLRGAI
jgi:glycosyltransferase involved in cell wall biosynthesis